MTLLMLWMALSVGLMAGADAGYTAQTVENASANYNAETGEFRIGNETTDVHETEDLNETQSVNGSEQPELPLSETGEKYFRDDGSLKTGRFTEDNVSAAPITMPDELKQPVENWSQTYANRTVDFFFELTADSADFAAGLTYKYRDTMSLDTIRLIIYFVTLAPPIAAVWATWKRVS